MKNKSAVALGKRSVEKRHAKLKEKGVDISEYYRQLRKKANKKIGHHNEGVLRNLALEYFKKGLSLREISDKLPIKKSHEWVRSVLNESDDLNAHTKYPPYSVKYFGGLRGKVLKRDGYKCKICSVDKVIQVHHIDRNKKNNIMENLVCLCPKCHRNLHLKKVDLTSVR